MAAYGITKFRFRGRKLIFATTIAVLLVPFPSIMVPVFIMTREMGLVNSYAGVIIPGILSPLGVFLMRQYLLAFPDEMIQAARVDGASEFGIFWRVIVPLSWPVIAAVGVLTFVASWNNLLWPLIVLYSQNLFTVPLALEQFNSTNSTDYVGMVAMSVVAVAPVIVLFLVARRRLIDSIMLSGGGLAG
jgi:ABC-type glycerol-3-phosphate transport system permease component